MPAIITHDTFGQDVYARLYELIGGSRDEAEAFLLGNQGPDPLFYAVADPRLGSIHKLGSRMHNEQPSEIIAAFRQAIAQQPTPTRAVARAYVMGFLCHYALDVNMHPFIFGQQYALCDAGEPGLTRKNGSDVHALIESELDELVLCMKREATLVSFNPSKSILRASNQVLDTISALYAHMAHQVFGQTLPPYAFKACVKAFRRVQALFYSPYGVKHNLIGRIEMKLRPYSFFRAMSHNSVSRSSSAFANAEHAPWENPYTREVSTEGFWELYERALEKAFADLPLLDAPAFSLADAQRITGGLNFSGKPAYAQIIAVE